MSCACCGDEWKERPVKIHSSGVQSISFVSDYTLLSKYGKQKIKLKFCDKHGNNLRDCTRFTNKGILQVRNAKTLRWNNAEKIGIVI